MIDLLEDYLTEYDEAFEQLEEFSPQMEKIKKANDVCNQILNFIDDEMNKFDENSFEELDIDEIVSSLNIKIDKSIESNLLTEIYSEIENTFKVGGRISLSEYLNQGNIIYSNMQNELMGQVDYSIAYSEAELKKAEDKAFERFCMVLSMNNTNEVSKYFNSTMESQAILNKNERYLSTIDGIPVSETLEEKISELNYMFLGMNQLIDAGCKIENEGAINSLITEKIKDLTLEVSEFSENESIKDLLEQTEKTIQTIGNANPDIRDICKNTIEKLDIVNEADFYNRLENQKSNDLER